MKRTPCIRLHCMAHCVVGRGGKEGRGEGVFPCDRIGSMASGAKGQSLAQDEQGRGQRDEL